LENDPATPAREITSRHGVDKRSLLPLAARRDAVARNAKSRMALEADVFILQRLLSRVQRSDWDFGSLEVNALFVSGNNIKRAARAFADFLIGELQR
jgi:hypothetical protein